MTLTAPSHLRGRMTRHTPKDLRDERIARMAARIAEGCTQAEMAAALGVTQSTISTTAQNHGLCRVRAPLVDKRVTKTGIRMGRLIDMFDGLPPETREELAAEAARMRGTIADAIAARLAPPKNRAGAPNG